MGFQAIFGGFCYVVYAALCCIFFLAFCLARVLNSLKHLWQWVISFIRKA